MEHGRAKQAESDVPNRLVSNYQVQIQGSRKWILTIIEGSPKRPLKTKACELKKKKSRPVVKLVFL